MSAGLQTSPVRNIADTQSVALRFRIKKRSRHGLLTRLRHQKPALRITYAFVVTLSVFLAFSVIQLLTSATSRVDETTLLPIQQLNIQRGQTVVQPKRLRSAGEIGPVTIFIGSSHYLGSDYGHVIKNCPWRNDELLQCEFTTDAGRRAASSAQWIHIPGGGMPSRTHSRQKLIIMSIER